MNLYRFIAWGAMCTLLFATSQAYGDQEGTSFEIANLVENEQENLEELETLTTRARFHSRERGTFTLKDLKGFYIFEGSSPGGAQGAALGLSVVELFRVAMNDNGTGVVTYISSRSSNNTGQINYVQSQSLPVEVVSLNSQGIARLIIHGWPLQGLDTHLLLMFRKRTSEIAGAAGQKIAVIQQPGSVTPIPPDYAGAIIDYKIVNQLCRCECK